MAVSKRTTSAPKAEPGSTTAQGKPEQTGGVQADRDVALQAEGRPTSVTAPNEVKNDPGATGSKEIDQSRVAAHQDALKARDGDNAKSPYSDIPAAGAAASNEGDDTAKTSDGKTIPPKPGSKKAAKDGDEDGEKEYSDEDVKAGNGPDGAALGTSFTYGAADFQASGVPVVEDQYSLDKVPDGTEFYAAWLHDPSKSDDHYGVVNTLSDLQSGKVSRRGIPASYWNGDHAKAPPKARRDVRDRKGYVIIG